MRILFFFLFILHLLAVPAWSGVDKDGNVTVFIYHKFGEDQYPTTNVAADRFAEQMQFLQDNNYTVLPLARLVQMLTAGQPLPPKSAVITIDDGYTSTYSVAWPILKKYGYPFTVFLYVEAVQRNFKNFLTWEQIAEMQAAGVDFQDHGYNHHRFGQRPAEMSDKEYRDWIREDLSKSNTVLHQRLGYKPAFLALPYGEYNAIVLQEVKKLGYRAAFSQDPGSVSNDTNLFAIPREPILGNDWATMDHFEMVLRRRDLPFINMVPPPNPLVDSAPEKFCVDLLYPDRYQPGTLGIYVSELGWQNGAMAGNRLCISNNAALQRRSNRVAVSGKEKESGRIAIRYWLLIKEQ